MIDLAVLLLACAPLFPQAAAVERFQPALAEDTALELEAYWEPCKGSLYQLFERTPVLRAPHPSEARRRYAAADFRPFLPQAPVALGEPWQVDGEAVLGFLSQLDPGATLSADPFGGRPGFRTGEVPGTWALLRAEGPDAFEILLRAHAVFDLGQGVIYKPAQFEGRLVLGRDGALRSFTLALPSRDTNVDVNVPYGPKGADGGSTSYEADIGWVPRMELVSGAAAVPAWSHSIPDEDARLALRRSFYPFAALDWLPFEEAVRASRERKKPLHLVLLFGCLDDDSC